MSTDLTFWYIFGSVAVINAISNGVFSYMIYRYLSKHGKKINYWWNLRFNMPKYLGQYRKLTIEEDGKPGNLFYAWIISTSLFLVSAIILVVIIATGK